MRIVRLWDPVSGQLRRTILMHSPRGVISGVAFGKDASHLATLNGNGTASLLRVSSSSPGVPVPRK
jgi:hypothetical protein